MLRNKYFLSCLLLLCMTVSKIAGCPFCLPSIFVTVSPGDTICAGTSVTFTAIVTNGGTAPAYQWQKNGVAISGATSSTYTTNNLAYYDMIACVLTSNASCANPVTATSNTHVMIVNPVVVPAIHIAASPDSVICAAAGVTFSASVTNGGSSPRFQWNRNGFAITGATNNSYYSASIISGDIFSCILTSNADCAIPTVANSNNITMTVNVGPVPGVSITANPGTTIVAGASITFTASAVNGGTGSAYQWRLNGANINGATNSVYSSSQLLDGDIVDVMLQSTIACASPNPVFSGADTITVRPLNEPYLMASRSEFTMLPNPTDGVFTLQTSERGVFRLYSLMGKEEYRCRVYEDNTVINLPLSIAQGLYFGRLAKEDGTMSGVLRLFYLR